MTDQPQKRYHPSNPRSEAALIGALLINPDMCADMPAGLTKDTFYVPINGELFDVITSVWRSGQHVNDITLAQELRKRDLFGEIEKEGRTGLAGYRDECPNESGAVEYATIVVDAWRKRRWVDVSAGVAVKANDVTVSADELDGYAIQKMSGVTADHASSVQSTKDAGPAAWEKLKHRIDHPEEYEYLKSPWTALNLLYNGCLEGQFHIIGGRPAMGKSLAADQWAVWLAEHGVHTMVHSLEMSTSEMIYREAARIAGIDSRKIMRAELDEEEQEKVKQVMTEYLPTLPLWYDDSAKLTLQDAYRKIRACVIRNNVRVVFIDYIQLMSDNDVEAGRQQNRQQEIAAISRGLKQIAMDLGITIIAVAQLNRSLEYRNNKRPTLADLRESGQIEQDAHVVIFVYRDEYYNEDTEVPGTAELIVAKNRNGATGIAIVGCNLSQLKFFDVVKQYLGDMMAEDPDEAELAELDRLTQQEAIVPPPEDDFAQGELL